VAAESHATRNGAAVFDQSYFGKIVLSDRDGGRLAQRAIDWMCTADFVSPTKGGRVGSTLYTAMCNASGGVEADLTVR
jgi:sarcosine dehydrogenase